MTPRCRLAMTVMLRSEDDEWVVSNNQRLLGLVVRLPVVHTPALPRPPASAGPGRHAPLVEGGRRTGHLARRSDTLATYG